MVRIEELKSMSIEELTELRKQIEDVINQKKLETQKEYKIEVSLTADPRKWFPYVAKLSVASDSLELVRNFYKLSKTYGKHSVTIFGTIEAKEGDIIEIREGGSWRNEYRSAYLVKNGKLVEICNHKDSKCYANIVKYLLGQLKEDDLIKKEQ